MISTYRLRAATVADLDALVQMHADLQDHLEESNPDMWRMKNEARIQVRGSSAPGWRHPVAVPW